MKTVSQQQGRPVIRYTLMVLLALAPAPAHSASLLPGAAGTGCMPPITVVTAAARLPTRLLEAIALVESGRPDPTNNHFAPWPWTINAEGTGYFYPTKEDAIAAVHAFQARGIRSIDVGCMQINLMHHPTAFDTLEDAFDPATNVAYGARFLSGLYRQFGVWPQAVAAYHSQTASIGADYWTLVAARWPGAARLPNGGRLPDPTPLEPINADRTPELTQRFRELAEDRRRNLMTTGMLTPTGYGSVPKTSYQRGTRLAGLR